MLEARRDRPIDFRYDTRPWGSMGAMPETPEKPEQLYELTKPASCKDKSGRRQSHMIEETIYIEVDIAKGTPDMVVSNSGEVRQFTNENEGITIPQNKVSYTHCS